MFFKKKKIDVAEWKWPSEDDYTKDSVGSTNIIQAIMTYRAEGITGSNKEKLVDLLMDGITILAEVTSRVNPPIPSPYGLLAKGCTFWALIASGGNVDLSDDLLEKYLQAIEYGDKAIKNYNRSTGWDSGTRCDFHLSMVHAHISLSYEQLERKNFNAALKHRDPARKHIEEAKKYASNSSLLQDMLPTFEKSLTIFRELGL